MMNEAFKQVIMASANDRRDLFLSTANRLGTTAQYVEKDFWVCWTLDALFNGVAAGGPRLLFKGGTSLSKAFEMISRFSEDIDVTVFRHDLGQAVEVQELEALSGKKRRARLDEIRSACQAYIAGDLLAQLRTIAGTVIAQDQFKIEVDAGDGDGQTLLFWYPAAIADSKADDYIRSAVKIESGAKSALDPHVNATLRPYVAPDVPNLTLDIANVTTVEPQRTFWDKVLIVHGLRQWYARRGELRHRGQRVSRHYYDIYRLLQADPAGTWRKDTGLAADCARHARMFFGSPDLGLEQAIPGQYTLIPHEPMRDALAKDYAAMSGMIFGDVPSLEEVLASIQSLETALNET